MSPELFTLAEIFMVSGPDCLAYEESARPFAQVQLHFAFLCRRSTASLSKPGLCLTNFIVKKPIPDVQRQPAMFQCVSSASCTDTWCYGKWSDFIFFLFIRCLHVPGNPPEPLLRLQSEKISAFSTSPHEECLESQDSDHWTHQLTCLKVAWNLRYIASNDKVPQKW